MKKTTHFDRNWFEKCLFFIVYLCDTSIDPYTYVGLSHLSKHEYSLSTDQIFLFNNLLYVWNVKYKHNKEDNDKFEVFNISIFDKKAKWKSFVPKKLTNFMSSSKLNSTIMSLYLIFGLFEPMYSFHGYETRSHMQF